jgi:hypothetical protein
MSGRQYDAPNQQVVRADGSGPADRGEGGSASEQPQQEGGLDAMTKAELLEYAQARGISPANNDMSKQEIRESIDAAEG